MAKLSVLLTLALLANGWAAAGTGRMGAGRHSSTIRLTPAPAPLPSMGLNAPLGAEDSIILPAPGAEQPEPVIETSNPGSASSFMGIPGADPEERPALYIEDAPSPKDAEQPSGRDILDLLADVSPAAVFTEGKTVKEYATILDDALAQHPNERPAPERVEKVLWDLAATSLEKGDLAAADQAAKTAQDYFAMAGDLNRAQFFSQLRAGDVLTQDATPSLERLRSVTPLFIQDRPQKAEDFHGAYVERGSKLQRRDALALKRYLMGPWMARPFGNHERLGAKHLGFDLAGRNMIHLEDNFRGGLAMLDRFDQKRGESHAVDVAVHALWQMSATRERGNYSETLRVIAGVVTEAMEFRPSDPPRDPAAAAKFFSALAGSGLLDAFAEDGYNAYAIKALMKLSLKVDAASRPQAAHVKTVVSRLMKRQEAKGRAAGRDHTYFQYAFTAGNYAARFFKASGHAAQYDEIMAELERLDAHARSVFNVPSPMPFPAPAAPTVSQPIEPPAQKTLWGKLRGTLGF